MQRAQRIGSHDGLGVAHAGTDPGRVNDGADGAEPGRGLEQPVDGVAIGDVGVGDGGRDTQVAQGGSRVVEAILPYIAQHNRPVAAYHLGRRQTMPPAPPVITVTCVMASTVIPQIRGQASGVVRLLGSHLGGPHLDFPATKSERRLCRRTDRHITGR